MSNMSPIEIFSSVSAFFMDAHIMCFADFRRVCGDDDPLPPEEENWLLCDPDISPLHHDSDPVPGVVLAQQRVRPCQDCVW